MAKPTTPSAYLAALASPRREDMAALDAAIRRAVPRLKPYVAYGGTMMGYGAYHYKYASGREGDCPIVAISSRAQYISLYVAGTRHGQSIAEAAKGKLGKVSVGKSCIRFKKNCRPRSPLGAWPDPRGLRAARQSKHRFHALNQPGKSAMHGPLISFIS